MPTDTIPAELDDLRDLTLEEIAALDPLPVLRRILPEMRSVPVAAFNSAI